MKWSLMLAALVLAAPASAQRVASPLEAGETLLEVSASGEIKAVPDVAEFSTGVTSDGASAQAALAANAKTADRLVSAVRAAGIADADVRTSELAVRPRYRPDKDGDDTDEIIGYRATNRLTVKVRDVAVASRIVDALTAAGATDLSGPSFSFVNDAPLKASARAEAVRQANRQARDYAAALNLKLGRILRVSERSASTSGGEDIIVTGSRAFAPIRPGEQSVNVTVWIDYALMK